MTLTESGSHAPRPIRARYERRDFMVLGGAIAVAALCALIARYGGLPPGQPLARGLGLLRFE